ncbi:MAG TPA: hemolysin family protein [Candidatus Krumholzibacteria bacterium]|nr:hemolysin family protein [Candidatus Krumholzibacteria bacterium]
MTVGLGIPLFLLGVALSTFYGAALAGLVALGRLVEERQHPTEPEALTAFILRDATSAIAAWLLGAFACGLVSVLALDAVVAAGFGGLPPLKARVAVLATDTVALVAGLLLWKRCAEAAPRGYCRAAAALVVPLYLVLYPLRRPLGAALARLYPPAARHAALFLATEWKGVQAEGDGPRVLDADEREMIQRVFLLGETVVREIMVPRIDMVAVEESTPMPQVLALLKEKRHSRLPVYRGHIDNIVGFLHLKDLVASLDRAHELHLQEILRPIHFVPETKRVAELLSEMREKRWHLAIVVDEYGGTAGLVTLEDVIEEVVGEIQDESDKEQPLLTLLEDGSYRVDAKVDLDELNEELQVHLPADEYDTLGGYLYALAGKIPAPGDRFTDSGLEFVIRGVRGRRITQVLVRAEKLSTPATVERARE